MPRGRIRTRTGTPKRFSLRLPARHIFLQHGNKGAEYESEYRCRPIQSQCCQCFSERDKKRYHHRTVALQEMVAISFLPVPYALSR